MEIIKEEYQRIVFKDNTATESEIINVTRFKVREKYCPAVKNKCLHEGCAFFTMGRHVTDQRIFRASCTYCGTRHLMEIYGWPSDKDIEKEWGIYGY